MEMASELVQSTNVTMVILRMETDAPNSAQWKISLTAQVVPPLHLTLANSSPLSLLSLPPLVLLMS